MKEYLAIARLLSSFWRAILVAAFFSFLTIGGNMGLMATSAVLISSAALQPPILDLMTLIVGVRFFGISRAVFRYLERYFSHDVTFRVLKKIRVDFYKKIEPLAPACLMDYRSGDLLARLVLDVETLKDFYLRVLAPPITALSILILAVVFLGFFDLRIALIVLMLYLVAGVFIPLGMARWSKGVKKQMLQVRSALNALLVDSIQGMTEILVYSQQGEMQARVARLSTELKDLQNRMARFNGVSSAVVQGATNLAIWGVLLVAIPMVLEGSLKGIHLAMVALTAGAAFEAVTPLPLMFAYWEESKAAWIRLQQVSDQAKPVLDPEGSAVPEDFTLEIRDLRFRYQESSPWVINGLSTTIAQGSKVGVIGPSGAGKSTLIHLLQRFYEYDGSIRLGGQELREIRQEDLRRYFGVVSQHTHLFHTTIRENLLIANPEATQEEMEKATKEAQIHDFIQSLPQGYDTTIGEGGYKLSGGQRQRLAIARVLLKNAPIIILDEALANLDAITEKELTERLLLLLQDKTAIVITHRPGILQHMDQILESTLL